jgi:hypothetical protein
LAEKIEIMLKEEEMIQSEREDLRNQLNNLEKEANSRIVNHLTKKRIIIFILLIHQYILYSVE